MSFYATDHNTWVLYKFDISWHFQVLFSVNAICCTESIFFGIVCHAVYHNNTLN